MITLYKTCILLIILLFISFPINAEEGVNGNLPYILTADGEISYDNQQGILSAVDNAHFEMADMELDADELIVYYNDNLIIAEGKLLLKVDEQFFEGSSLEFNYRTMSGTILDPSSELKDLSFSGSKISLLESNKYEIDGVELTPCLFPDPHYSIKAKRIVVYPEERIVATDVWFYFAGHKVFYLPSYTLKYSTDTSNYDDISFVPELGYNTKDGFHLTIDYPYEISDDFRGEMNGMVTQYGNKYFKMDNTYNLNPVFDIKNSYLYEDIEEDDGDIIESNLLSAGVKYHDNGFNIYTGIKRDFILEENRYDFDGRYRYKKLNLRYFNEFRKNELLKEIYTINYNSKYPLELTYKKGYDIEYLPYLTIDKINSSLLGVNINSKVGIGKVANKDIVSDRIRMDINMNKPFITTNSFRLSGNALIESNYYMPIDEIQADNLSEDMYNYYKLGLNSSYQNKFTDNLQIKASLGYNYSWDKGNAYLPEDENETHEYLNPGLGIAYRKPEEFSAWHLDLKAKYEIRDDELEEVNLRLKRELDCYDYYIGIDIIDKGLELGINF